MKLNRPLRFEIGASLRLEPKRFSSPLFHSQYSAVPVTRAPLSLTEFKGLMARYKRAGFEWSQLWLQSQQRSLFEAKTPSPMIVRKIVDPFEYVEWTIEEWTIKFMLSDKLLTHARKQSTLPNWHEDPLVIATWEAIISMCFRSIEKYHKSFHILPMVGDRLFNEDTGWRIQDRSIDGDLMTITFTMDS